ncbi:MAG: hypothetical protein HON04_07720 [Planctomicrobium sp.]|nr:hypothetical protein [Planctomicrobium sp.]
MARVAQTGIIFEDKKFAANCWTHNVEDLFKQAGLKPVRDQDVATKPNFGANWLIAKDWSEVARYNSWTEAEAKKLYDALTEQTDGVLPWIQKYW